MTCVGERGRMRSGHNTTVVEWEEGSLGLGVGGGPFDRGGALGVVLIEVGWR